MHGERSGSGSSVKRRRGQQEEQEEAEDVMDIEDTRAKLREELEDYLMWDTNRFSKESALFVLRRYRKIESILVSMELKVTRLKGQLDTYERKMATPQEKPSYSEILIKNAPRVGKKRVVARDPESVVLAYPQDEEVTDSEETKKVIKETIVPKQEGIQFRAVRKITKGGLAIETGTKEAAINVREALARVPSIKCADPRRRLPRMQIFDVEQDMKMEDFHDFLYTQNLVDKGISLDDINKNVMLCFKTGRRDLPVCNWVIEVTPEMRVALLEEGRVYLDFAACRVVDFLAVARCFKCLAYGHSEKNCKKDGGNVCSHCDKGGHLRKDCHRIDEKPACINCLAAKKPSDHRVGTIDCPMYTRLVEQRISLTDYGRA